MDFGFYGVFMFASVLAVQYFFSTRNHVYWGAILPVAYIVMLTWLLLSNRLESTIGYVLYLMLGLFFLVAEWKAGRKYLQEKRKKELAQIKTRDMK